MTISTGPCKFSGYVAADELYDGPYCVLSLVDNRTFQRIAYEVLEQNPDPGRDHGFLRRFQAAIVARNLRCGDHDRWFSPVSWADFASLWQRAASGVRVPRAQGTDQVGVAGSRQFRKELAAKSRNLPRRDAHRRSPGWRRSKQGIADKVCATLSMIDICSSRHHHRNRAEDVEVRCSRSAGLRRTSARLWMKSTGCLTEGAARIRPWPNLPTAPTRASLGADRQDPRQTVLSESGKGTHIPR